MYNQQIMTTKHVSHVNRTVHPVKTDQIIAPAVTTIWLCMNINAIRRVRKTPTKQRITSKLKFIIKP